MNRFIIGALALVMAATASARGVETNSYNGSIVDVVNMNQAAALFSTACEYATETELAKLDIYDYSDPQNPMIQTETCTGATDMAGRRVDFANPTELFNQHDGVKHVKVRVYNIVRAQ